METRFIGVLHGEDLLKAIKDCQCEFSDFASDKGLAFDYMLSAEYQPSEFKVVGFGIHDYRKALNE